MEGPGVASTTERAGGPEAAAVRLVRPPEGREAAARRTVGGGGDPDGARAGTAGVRAGGGVNPGIYRPGVGEEPARPFRGR